MPVGLWNWVKNLLFSESSQGESDVENLVDGLRMFAVASESNMVEEFPPLKQISSEKYTFFMTNAAVAIALLGIKRNRPGVYQWALDAAEEQLRHHWGADGPKAVMDCSEFVTTALSDTTEIEENQMGEALDYATGRWIVWNMMGEKPDDAYRRMESALGRFAVETAVTYWE